MITFLFAVYSTMRAGHRVVSVAGSVLMLATLPSPRGLTTYEAFAQTRDVLQIAWLIAAAAADEALRQAERRANEERLHIAREIHDYPPTRCRYIRSVVSDHTDHLGNT